MSRTNKQRRQLYNANKRKKRANERKRESEVKEFKSNVKAVVDVADSKNSDFGTVKKVRKNRNWAFIVYPESVPNNWRDMIAETGLPFAVSPLHNADVNADENEKKEHWHVLVCYSGPTTIEVVKLVTERINATMPQVVHNLRGYYRYLTHKDNPEKAQYLETDIELFNGFQPPDFTVMTAKEKLNIRKHIVSIIQSEEIYEYSVLIDYLILQEDMEQELYFATTSTIFFTSYLNSRRHRLREVLKGETDWFYNHEPLEKYAKMLKKTFSRSAE